MLAAAGSGRIRAWPDPRRGFPRPDLVRSRARREPHDVPAFARKVPSACLGDGFELLVYPSSIKIAQMWFRTVLRDSELRREAEKC